MRGNNRFGVNEISGTPACRGLMLLVLVLLFAYSSIVQATPISRSITIDGDMSDWTVPTDIINNPGQFSTDGDGSVCPSTDLDADADGTGPAACNALTPGGRDLARFSYTWDNTSLYFYVERTAGTNNVTDWFFYMDLGNDGFMGPGDKVLRIAWSGNTGNTNRELWDYTPIAGGLGDAIGGDGTTMPGSISISTSLAGASGGSANGLSMESWIDFSDIGLTGPQSIRFHISSGNSTSLPGGIIDNMNGPVGSGLQFADIAVSKTSSVDAAGWVYSGGSFNYIITIANNGDSTATGIQVTDVLPTDVTYVSHVASTGSYDPDNADPLVDDIWFVPTLAVGGSATLTITVTANQVSVNTDVTNSVSLTGLVEADPDASNNSASNTIQIRPYPNIVISKTVSIQFDPVNNTSDPQAIPQAKMRYRISVDNTGFGATNNNTTVITDILNSNVDLLHDVIGVGPVIFTDRGTGMTLDTTNIEYFDTAWGATPSPIGGVDIAIRGIRISPQGSIPAWSGTGATPGFDIEFDVRIK